MSLRLQMIEVEAVRQDPDNPRKVFPPEELERLSASIAEEGVLVPVVVHESSNGYQLIDGDRRWQCARQLGLEDLPAIIVDKPDDLAKLVQMFNIHQVREQWQDMPMAWALGKLVEGSGIEDNQTLSERTGLSVERVKRLRHALDLPEDYQKLIYEGEIPLNFFWELKRNVIDPLVARRADLVAKHGKSCIVKSFVDKRLQSVVTDTVSLRKVRPIINASADDHERIGTSEIDATLDDLIQNIEASIEDAYEDTVMLMVEADKLKRRSVAVVKGFARLIEKASSEEEEQQVKAIAREVIRSLGELVG